jgi:hypothetical protein
MAKKKDPKDDMRTVAKSRMAHMPAETAGGRMDLASVSESADEATPPADPVISRKDKQRSQRNR